MLLIIIFKHGLILSGNSCYIFLRISNGNVATILEGISILSMTCNKQFSQLNGTDINFFIGEIYFNLTR